MLKLTFSALLLSACLGGTKALAQQQTAPAAAQPAPTAAQPAATDTPPTSWVAAAAYVGEAEADPVSRSGGQQIAPGFTAAPTHRVMTDYQNRPLAKPFKRVRRVDAPAPATPAPATPAPATNTLGNPMAAPAPAPAPAKETPAGSDW